MRPFKAVGIRLDAQGMKVLQLFATLGDQFVFGHGNNRAAGAKSETERKRRGCRQPRLILASRPVLRLVDLDYLPGERARGRLDLNLFTDLLVE